MSPAQLKGMQASFSSPGSIDLTKIKEGLFSPLFNSRWASSASIQEPDCVSFLDHGLGTAPIDNIKVINDMKDGGGDKQPRMPQGQIHGVGDEEHWLREQSAARLNQDQSGPFEFPAEDEGHADIVKATLHARHLSRRERVKHHHHHQQQLDHHHHEHHKRDVMAEPQAEAALEAPHVAIRADSAQGQSVYVIEQEDGGDGDAEDVLLHESVGHTEMHKENGQAGEGQQRVLAQAGSGVTDPTAATESLNKAGAGHLDGEEGAMDSTAAVENDGATSDPHKGVVLLAAVPILLLMGAIAGFTVYRRFRENSVNPGGRNDTRDDYSGDGYHRRDVPIRKGSPIHFDRTFLNTIHSPPPTATYLHDPENSSRNQSPSSVASVSMKRPPPSAGSLGKTRFQELNRSYDFSAGFRSIKNALTRSTNNSRESALHHAGGASGSGSNNSLYGKGSSSSTEYAFGTGGHSIAKIGSHPGLNALERQQLQQQYGAGAARSSSGSNSRFPDMNTLTIPQEHTIVWSQYSADDNGLYQDTTSATVSNLARKSASSNSLTMQSTGKYSHHQSSGHQQPGTPTDSIGDCLAPESPSMTREEMMRRRDLYAEGYNFGSEEGDDANSGTDLLFDARDHFLDLGAGVKGQDETALCEEEMDMYLDMEKEESPYMVDDYNSMNPSPYEPKAFKRQPIRKSASAIQKSAPLSEKESYISLPDSQELGENEVFDEKKALEAEDEAAAAHIKVQVAVEPEETHVLGSASPEWTASSNNDNQAATIAVKRLSATQAFGRVQAALSKVSDSVDHEIAAPLASQIVDPVEWERESRVGDDGGDAAESVATVVSPSLGQGQQGKKKANKSKAKKSRKH
ncbi:hypothetical protein BGZ98_007881 [Dissophora globulifera]|nr:hypothetical protein BGZ98_007881 [Dissophora globulifera]